MALPERTLDNGTYPRFVDGLPADLPSSGAYEVGFARSRRDLKEVQALRYRVFNLELGEGSKDSHATGRDADQFDEVCHHLVVRFVNTGEIVGTYRMLTLEMAKAGAGWYSATEFDLSPLPDRLQARSVELGRACIAKEHRSLKVLYLLWKGLGAYMAHNRREYAFGCCSLTSQDARDGSAVYAFLRERGFLHSELQIRPLPSHVSALEESVPPSTPPRLMMAYLSLGAKICSEPAIDREFQTIDFLTLIDVQALGASDLAFYKVRQPSS